MLVLGNGTSRRKINLNSIYEEKIGCNAIFRDYYVEHLVCCDKRLVKQALPHHSNIYTRDRWNKDFNVNPLPMLPYKGKDRKDEPIHWGSGPYAVLLSATLSDKLKLIGFDLYGLNNNVNNIYSGTEGYDTKQAKAVDHSYWVYQIGKVFENFPKKKFIIYNESDWIMPKEWQYPNVSLDNYSKLLYNN